MIIQTLYTAGRELLEQILDWCFPPRAGEQRVRSINAADLQPTVSYPSATTHCLFPFQQPDIQALVHEAKFSYNRKAHKIIGAQLATYITSHWPKAILIPIPLHPARQEKRGFNQVIVALKTQPSIWAQVRPTLLQRSKHTKPQHTLNQTDRHTNVADAFRVTRAPTLPSHVPCIIIDDVYTTGATLTAARTAVRAAYPSNPIYCLTFAYA